MHISPDVVYLYAGGTVSTCKEARKIKMSGTVFRQRQQFFQTVEVNVPPFELTCSSLVVLLLILQQTFGAESLLGFFPLPFSLA